MNSSQMPREWFDLPTFALHVTIHIDPSNVEQFLDAMRPAFDACANEPECLYFEIFQDPVDPGAISWVENWAKGVEWFVQEQMAKGYYKELFESTKELGVERREWSVRRRLEGFVAGNRGNFVGAREQLTKEYYKPYLEKTEPMFLKPREMKVLKRVEGLVMSKAGNFEGARVGEYRK